MTSHHENDRKLTLNVTPALHERLQDNSNAKGVTIAEYIRRAIANVATIEMAREMCLADGGSGDLYIAPRSQPDRPVHLLPMHGLI